MAKSHDDDAFDDLDEVEEIGEVEEIEVEEVADADADADADAVEEIEEVKEIEEEKEPLKPKVTALTLVLCVLNLLAICAFAFLLLMAYGKRQEFSYAAFRFDLALWGLPLEEEEHKITPEKAARTPAQISPDELKQQFTQRGTRVSVKEPFQSVHEVLGPDRIRPSQLSDQTLKEVFQGAGTPVRTLEAELQQLRGQLFDDIRNAAEQAADKVKTPPQQRQQLTRLLLPLALTSADLSRVNQQIATANPTELKNLLVEAGQRRMLVELLRMLQSHRPVPGHAEVLHEAGNRDKIKLDKLHELVNARFDLAVADQREFGPNRASYDKRNAIGALLAAVAHLKQPDQTPLYSDGPSRAMTVLGIQQYNKSLVELAQGLKNYRQEFEARTTAARSGEAYEEGDQTLVLPGFPDKQAEYIDRMFQVLAEIKNRERRLDELKAEVKHSENLYNKRESDYNEVVQQILTVRKETAALVEELRRLERQLFLAEKELADAGERNRRLEEQIQKLEQSLGVE